MSEHTPGPWEISEDDDFRIRNQDWGDVCMVFDGPSEEETPGLTEMCKSNAHLIAAAPEMLEFLETMDRVNVFDDDCTFRKALRAVIAKARGK